jgi:hypothetical protein
MLDEQEIHHAPEEHDAETDGSLHNHAVERIW